MDKKKLKDRAYHEFKGFLFAFLYLFVFFGLFTVYKSLVLSEHHIDFAAHGVALINALILAKFLVVAKAFHPGRRAENAPLIYPTLLKAAIFAIILAILKILEDVIAGHFHGKSFTESIADLGGGTGRGILILTGILYVVLIPLTAFGELDRVIGEGKLSTLFFRRRDLSQPFGQHHA